MPKKLLICAVMVLTAFVFGCGSDKILGAPDKAVLAYAEISMTGESENMSAAGFTDSDKQDIRYRMAQTFTGSLASIAPLNDDSAKKVTDIYFDKLKSSVKFDVKLKKDDAERPVVELTTTPIDQNATVKLAVEDNENLIALIGMVGKLKADGATDDDLKNNAQVQDLAVTALAKYIEDIQFYPAKTLEVQCKKATDKDGNIHWAPLDEELFVNFLIGEG
ncbi:MAG: DUF5105 domain-containing protein [Selenomonadaceae bacterium]|nr:DUF5105 domain-containing protein [Selenomonadaceae bacterium]